MWINFTFIPSTYIIYIIFLLLLKVIATSRYCDAYFIKPILNIFVEIFIVSIYVDYGRFEGILNGNFFLQKIYTGWSE